MIFMCFLQAQHSHQYNWKRRGKKKKKKKKKKKGGGRKANQGLEAPWTDHLFTALWPFSLLNTWENFWMNWL